MLTIAKLFGKSPFAPLQSHMDKVASCIAKLPILFKAVGDQDAAAIEQISDQISQLAREADVTKNDIRTHLPKSLFLPVDRGILLEILSFQDALCEQAEKIALKSTLFPLASNDGLRADFTALCQKSIEGFLLTRKVVKELDDLLECSFGGLEAEKVKRMLEQISFFESESERLEYRLTRTIYLDHAALSPPAFHLWLALTQELSLLACLCRKLGDRIRMLLELK